MVSWVLVAPLVTDGMHLTRWQVPAAWHALGALGPLVAAGVVSAVGAGHVGLRRFLTDLRPRQVGRVGVGGVLAALSPVALLTLAVIALRLAGTPWPDLGRLAAAAADPAWLLGAVLAAVAYGVGEEPGWRGFALPRLQRRHSALVAAGLVTADKN